MYVLKYFCNMLYVALWEKRFCKQFSVKRLEEWDYRVKNISNYQCCVTRKIMYLQADKTLEDRVYIIKLCWNI